MFIARAMNISVHTVVEIRLILLHVNAINIQRKINV